MMQRKRAADYHELKYLINKPDYALLQACFVTVLFSDPNVDSTGEYWIRSLYFDDYWATAYEDKDIGVQLRRKYRIRVYNCQGGRIMLERKNKVGAYIRKEAAPLTHGQTEAVLGELCLPAGQPPQAAPGILL